MSRNRPRVGDSLPIDIDRPFTRAAGLHAGLSDTAMQGRAFRRLFTGVYIHSGIPVTAALWSEAARLITPAGAFATHHTAARALGAIVPFTSVTHVGAVTGARTRTRGIRLHRYAALPDLVEVDGQLVTGAVQTFLDLADRLDLVDLVVLGDSLVHLGHTTPEELVDAATGRTSRLAREAAAYVRAGAQSGPETRLRLLYVLAGLPEPSTQVRVARSNGGVFWLDLGWEEVLAASEYDGEHHALQQEHDADRRAEIRDAGWELRVVTSPDLWRTPGALVTDARAMLTERGLRLPTPQERWRAHFLNWGAA